MLFWSELWYGKLIFLKLFLEKILSSSKMSFWYIYSGTTRARRPTGRHSVGRVSGAGVVASHTCIPNGFIYYRDHFIYKITSFFFFFWASCSNHCLAALDLRTDVEQPFDCLIVQNRQAMQSIGRSMDWTSEDNMVDGLFFCSKFTGRRGGHTAL